MAASLSGSSNFSGSAKIYTFPLRGRYALRDRGDGFTAAADVQLPHGARLAPSTSGWYHDAAIQDAITAEQTRKS